MHLSLYAVVMIAFGVLAESGPTLAADKSGGVLIDYDVPQTDGDFDLKVQLEFGGGVDGYSFDIRGYIAVGEDGADFLLHNARDAGVKVELVSKTKLRVLGFEKGGKLYPVISGKATSKTLPADKLPKITNPPKA